MGWRLFQLVVFLAFVFANIFFEWKIQGGAAAIMGGMLAWYASFIVSLVLWKAGLGPRFGIEAKPSISLTYRSPSKPPSIVDKDHDPQARS